MIDKEPPTVLNLLLKALSLKLGRDNWHLQAYSWRQANRVH